MFMFEASDLPFLKTGLEVSYRENLEASHNLVNADTPGFTPKHTDFRSLLFPMQKRPPLPRGKAFELYMQDVAARVPFDLERELARLSQTGLDNAALTRLLSQRYNDLRTVIREAK